MSKGQEYKRATPKWICGSEFDPRPENISGLPRVELVRTKDSKVQFLATYIESENIFQSVDTCETYGAGSVEVKIIEVK